MYKLLNINVRIWFKKCKMHHLTPRDIHINIKGGNKRVANTIQAEVKMKIKQELEYVH